MNRADLVCAAVLLAGCAAFGPREADRYFVLEALAPARSVRPAAPRRDVIVAPTTAASFYDTQSIAFSREAGTRAYYQFNHWTERPQNAVHGQLVARLQSERPRGELLLRTHLEAIYHDAVVPPGIARIALRAELVDAATRALVARRTFVREAPAASYDAQGAVQGFDAALGALIEDMVRWVDEQAAPKNP